MSLATLRYLKVPLQIAPLLLIIVFSLLMLLAIKAKLLGIALGILLLSGFLRYSFVLLDGLVDGRDDPPVLSIEMMNPISEQRSLALLVLLVAVFFTSDAALYWMGPLAVAIVGLVAVTVLLSIVAVQGATGSLAQSLNPVRGVRLMRRLGGDYALIIACAVAFMTLIKGANAISLPLILRIALFMYAWLAVFSLIGGTLFERRDELGLSDAHEPEIIEPDAEPEIERARQLLLDRIYAEWRGGAHTNAWQTLMNEVDRSADAIAELRWLYEHSRNWPDHRLPSRIAQELLPRLLAMRRTGEALDLTRERLERSNDFRPIASADLLRLAELARDAGDRRTARTLLSEFEKFFPEDSSRIAVHALSEQMKR